MNEASIAGKAGEADKVSDSIKGGTKGLLCQYGCEVEERGKWEPCWVGGTAKQVQPHCSQSGLFNSQQEQRVAASVR